jgi:hypothetical protein
VSRGVRFLKQLRAARSISSTANQPVSRGAAHIAFLSEYFGAEKSGALAWPKKASLLSALRKSHDKRQSLCLGPAPRVLAVKVNYDKQVIAH